MLCTICGKRLNPIKDDKVVWRTVQRNNVLPVEWAKLPIHNACSPLIEREIMNSKIRIAAGISSFMYAKEKPVKFYVEVNEEGEQLVNISDGQYKYVKLEGL